MDDRTRDLLTLQHDFLLRLREQQNAEIRMLGAALDHLESAHETAGVMIKLLADRIARSDDGA